MEKERIWILLSRELAGELNKAEQAELDELLEKKSPRDSAWSLLNGQDLEAVEEDAALDAAGLYWEKQQEVIESHSVQRRGWFRTAGIRWIAAASLTGLILFSLWNTLPSDSTTHPEEASFMEISAGPGQKKNLTLPDGSQVVLNENSRFRYNKNMSLHGDRSASLSGEAYFEIVSNPGAPFRIQTPQMEIKVLGTRFNVRANVGDSLSETTLFHGKIEVTLPGEGQEDRKVLLQPEEKLTVKNNRYRITSLQPPTDSAWSQTTQYTISDIAKPATENIYKENAWASGKVIFDDDPLSRVAAFLEEKYHVQVVISDPNLLQETRIRGVFRDDSLVSILEALQFTSGFRYEIADSVVTIY